MHVMVLSDLSPTAHARLARRHTVDVMIGRDLRHADAELAACEAIVLRSGVELTSDLLARAPRLRLIVRAGSGIDNVDLAAADARGIRVVRIPGPGADAVAEMALALMLALTRNVVRADQDLRSGAWTKHDRTGISIRGRRLGIVGVGNIGGRVGMLGATMGMDVSGCVDVAGPQAARRLDALGIRLVSLEDVLRTSDVISIHVPLTTATRRLIDARALGLVQPGSYLVNLSRGGVVDEMALRAALLDGRLAGAALDVHEHEGASFASPLSDLPTVVLTPHIGAGTHEAQEQIGQLVVAAIDDAANSDPELALLETSER